MSSSLPVTPTTPITPSWRYPVMTKGIDQPSPSQTLFAFLSIPTESEEVEGALAEFFFRSLASGRRVREWCEDLGRVAQNVLHSPALHTAIRSPLLTLVFPFSKLSHSTSGTTTPTLVSASILPTLSRKQLVDGLVRLSRRLAIPSLKVDGWQEAVVELCLEYVGRRWRLALEKHETDLIGGIGLKLLEVEFDLQLRGHPSTSRPLILPILQRVRFDLGLITASQLVTRLNSPRHHIPSATSSISAYLATHLRAGESPQDLVDELLQAYDSLTDPCHRDQMITSVSTFGLRFDEPDEIQAVYNKPPPTSPGRIGRRFSLLTKTFGLSSPKWLTHRRHDSSSRLGGMFPASFNPDRRPSLPNVSTTSLLHPLSPISRSKLSTGTESPRSPTGAYSRLSQPQGLFSSPDLLASTLSLIDATNLRPALVGQLLSMKYHLTTDPSDDWYLGEGRIIAQRLITDIEDKLLSTQSQIADITELRKLFHLPRETTEYPSELQDLLSGEFGNFPVPPLRFSMVSSVDGHSRATSFDLDRYFEGISEVGDEGEAPNAENGPSGEHEGRTSMDALLPKSHRRRSAGLDSLLTVTTGKTGATSKSRGRRSSSHTSFTIQKATRGWTGYPAQLIKPRRVRSIDDRASGRVCLNDTAEADDYVPINKDGSGGSEGDSDLEELDELDDIPAIASYLPPRSNRWSRSETDLIFPSPPTDPYTRIPPSNSLRRRKRMQKPSLSAIDLGLGRQVLTPPGFPQSPPPTDDDPETPTPTASTFGASRSSAGPVPFFSPLASPFSPVRAQALMPEGYAAPLTPPTSPPQATLDLGSDTPRASRRIQGQDAPPAYLSWSPLWLANAQSSTASNQKGGSTSQDDVTPRIQRQINRQYRILDGDLSPEKKPSDGESSVLLPVIREDPPSPVRHTLPNRRSPTDSPLSEDWYTAPETPGPRDRRSPRPSGTSAEEPIKSGDGGQSLGLPVPPPRNSSRRRIRPSTSQNSLSGVTTWSMPSYNPHSPVITPAPLDLDGIASRLSNLGSPFQNTAETQSRATSAASWTSSEGSSDNLSAPVNPLKSVLGLFLDPSQGFILHPNVTEGHIRFVLEEVLKKEIEEDEREHVKWLLTKVTDLIYDSRWHRQVGPYLEIWNPAMPPTPPTKPYALPDLTPRNLRPPKSHPFLSSMPRPQLQEARLPWSASSPDIRQPSVSPASTLMASTSSTTRLASTSSSALMASTSSSSTVTNPETPLLRNSSGTGQAGQAALIIKRRMNKFRLSISTFGRRDSFVSSSSSSPTKSQTIYEALRG